MCLGRFNRRPKSLLKQNYLKRDLSMVTKFRERHKLSYIVCANVFTITLEIRVIT